MTGWRKPLWGNCPVYLLSFAFVSLWLQSMRIGAETPPYVISALLNCERTQLTVTFVEPIQPMGGTDVFNYHIYQTADISGLSMHPFGSLPIGDNGSRFLLSLPRNGFIPDNNSVLRVEGMTDLGGLEVDRSRYYPIQLCEVPEPGTTMALGVVLPFVVLWARRFRKS